MTRWKVKKRSSMKEVKEEMTRNISRPEKIMTMVLMLEWFVAVIEEEEMKMNNIQEMMMTTKERISTKILNVMIVLK